MAFTQRFLINKAVLALAVSGMLVVNVMVTVRPAVTPGGSADEARSILGSGKKQGCIRMEFFYKSLPLEYFTPMVFYPVLIAGGCLCGWPHNANMNTAQALID